MDADPDRAADPSESVLGNLPRSRPGQRSDKRAGRAAAAARGRADGGPAQAPRVEAGPERAARPDLSGVARSKAGEEPRTDRPAHDAPGGPVEGAVHLAGRAARLGLDVAGGVLKRLPRP